MSDWWLDLTGLNRLFYGGAAFFSVFFVWQMIATIMGLSGETGDDAGGDAGDLHDAGADVGADAHGDVGADVHDHAGVHDDGLSTATFRLLSIRSIITFFTLFFWAGALYLNRGDSVGRAMTYAVMWGCLGMVTTAGIFYFVARLSSSGNRDLRTAIGSVGTVYLDIPKGGRGEVRVVVSGVVSYVKAGSADGRALKSGTPVRVMRRLEPNVIEVERMND
jgi:hypothetical protein